MAELPSGIDMEIESLRLDFHVCSNRKSSLRDLISIPKFLKKNSKSLHAKIPKRRSDQRERKRNTQLLRSDQRERNREPHLRGPGRARGSSRARRWPARAPGRLGLRSRSSLPLCFWFSFLFFLFFFSLGFSSSDALVLALYIGIRNRV